jgi:hypothetical protein
MEDTVPPALTDEVGIPGDPVACADAAAVTPVAIEVEEEVIVARVDPPEVVPPE